MFNKTHSKNLFRSRGNGKRLATLGDAEQRGLLSPGEGLGESPPGSERPGFVPGIFFVCLFVHLLFWVSFIWPGLPGPSDFPA